MASMPTDDDILCMLDEFGADNDSDTDAFVESDHNTNSELSENENVEEDDPLPLGFHVPAPPQLHHPEAMDVTEGHAAPSHHQGETLRELSYNINTNELYKAKDGTSWRMVPTPRGRSRYRRCDLVRHLPGVLREAKDANTPLKALELFFSNEMLQEVVKNTNIYIRSIQDNFDRERDAGETDLPELKACLGLLFLAGVKKMSHTDLVDLWKTDGTGVEFFRLTMGINRFRFLLRCLRFDNITTRNERKATDKLAAIRYLLDHFNANCQKHYSLSEMVTIDEMLDAFRGRCGFRQYIPNKPAKYGIKVFALTDAKMYYTNNIEVYCGKQPDGPYQCENDAFSIVKRLVSPISNSGRNVTCDNWFTSLPLVQDLLHNEKLTVVGTLRGNRKGIPDFMKTPKNHPVGSTIFAYKDNITLVSFKPKSNKIVLAISSLHPEDDTIVEVPHLDMYKPEIILYYNSTKSGVDKVDEMKAAYSVSRITRRWTLSLFFTMLNIGGINAYVVFKANTASDLKRNEFLSALAKQLLDDYLRIRVQKQNLPVSIRFRLSEILQVPQPRQAKPQTVAEGSRGRCTYCDRKKNRPTKYKCNNCDKYICFEHVTCYLCGECNEKMQFIEAVDDSE